MGSRLFVGNLAWATTDQDLVDFFGAGAVKAKVITDRESGRSRGFAFVETTSAADAERIVREFDGAMLSGRELRISEAEERSGPSSSRPSGGSNGLCVPSAPPTEVRRGGGGRGSQRRGRDHDRDDW